MTTYTIEINDQQMTLIEKALKLLQSSDQFAVMDSDDVEEIDLMVGIIGMTRAEEAVEPGTIHGWCY